MTPDNPQHEPARILVVEDDFLIAMELETLLQENGFIVLGPAAAIPRALALIEAERPDVALLDVNLNGQQATPVAAALRARSIPFVIISGYGRHQIGEPEFRDAPLISKPVRGEALIRMLAALQT